MGGGKETHGDVGEGRPDHEVVGAGLQLQDLRGGEHHPDGGEDEQQHGGEEGQEGLVQVAVLQRVVAVGPVSEGCKGVRSISVTSWVTKKLTNKTW